MARLAKIKIDHLKMKQFLGLPDDVDVTSVYTGRRSGRGQRDPHSYVYVMSDRFEDLDQYDTAPEISFRDAKKIKECGTRIIMSDRKNMLEAYVAEKMREVYKYARPTIASGATPIEKGDIKNPWFGIECKQKRTAKAFTIPHAEWYKNCGESDNEYKDPVFIVENEDGERIAAMRLDEWFNLIYELMELRKKLEEGYVE